MPTKLVTTTTSLEGSKNKFKSFIYGQSSPANFVNIGPADVEIIGLAEINKNVFLIKQTTAKHKPSSPAFRAERVG